MTREHISAVELKALKILILAEYENTTVASEIASKLGIPTDRMRYYMKKWGLKGAGYSNLTPALKEKILEEYKVNQNFPKIASNLNLSVGVLRSYAYILGLTPGPRDNHIVWVDDIHVKCSKCPKIMLYADLELIRPNGKYPSRISYCRDCRTKQIIKNNKSSLESYLANRARTVRTRAKSNGYPCDLNTAYLMELYRKQEGKCFYTDENMEVPEGGKVELAFRLVLSVDKIIPTLGYVKGNVVLCTLKANTIKGDLSMEEMKIWLPSWYERLIQK